MSITEQIQGQNDPSMLEVLKDIGDIAKQGLRDLFKESVPRLTDDQARDLVDIAWGNVPHTVQEDDPQLFPDPHADLKAQWELDVHCVGENEAIKLWETRSPAAWFTCTSQPLRDNADYRRKPDAPDWSQEIGLREVQNCPEWPKGFDIEGTTKVIAFYDRRWRRVWEGGRGWTVQNGTAPVDEVLTHLKKFRPGGERYAQEKVH